MAGLALPAVGPRVLEGKAARVGLRRSALAACALIVVCALAGTASAAKSGARRVISTPATIPLRTALLDPLYASADRQQAFAMTAATGATYIRLSVVWACPLATRSRAWLLC